MTESTSERIDPGAEAAHRDDLAREAARRWMSCREGTVVGRGEHTIPNALVDALDRLAAAYGVQQ